MVEATGQGGGGAPPPCSSGATVLIATARWKGADGVGQVDLGHAAALQAAA